MCEIKLLCTGDQPPLIVFLNAFPLNPENKKNICFSSGTRKVPFHGRNASFPYVFSVSGVRTSNIPRRVSRAGLLNFPTFLLLLVPNTPKFPPTRFPVARRIAPFPYGFAAFDTQIPQFFPARFARRIASFSYGFAAF